MDSVTLFVQDRAGRPLAKKALRVQLQLTGWRRLPDGSSLPCHDSLQRQAHTDAQGKAQLTLGFAFEGTWRATLTSGEAQMLALSQSEDTLTVFEPPDRFLADGTPLWEPTR
uniref:hypothetical protein n=1 Tax=Armatimonas sp. TaxID=1872638 RepID=UPI00375209F5